MAKILRPRRGKRAFAQSQNIVLAKGEMFLGYDRDNPGNGPGYIYVGDGSTSFSSLQPFITDPSLATVSHATNADTATYATSAGSATSAINASTSAYATSVSWGNVGGKPSTYPPTTGNAATQAAAGNHTHSAYVNQNAFSNVKVGSTTVAADTTTDTIELAASGGITLTPDATNDKVTISSTTYTTFSTSANGLVPKPASAATTSYLNSSGTWTVPVGTAYTAGTGLSLSGSAFSLATTGTAGTYGPSANVTGNDGATISVPQITTDSYGRVTAVTNRTYTSKNTTYANATTETHGLLPKLYTGDSDASDIYLKGNGSWGNRWSGYPTRNIYAFMVGNTTNSASAVNSFTRLTGHTAYVNVTETHPYLLVGQVNVYFGATDAIGYINFAIGKGNTSTYTDANVQEMITVPAASSGFVRLNVCRQLNLENGTYRLCYTKHLNKGTATTVSAQINVIDIGMYQTLTQG